MFHYSYFIIVSNKNTSTRPANCKKTISIMPTYHYVQNQGKLKMQSRENGQKPKFGLFFDDIEVKYLQIANFLVLPSIQAKNQKIVTAVFEKNISVWFWTNLETFSRISPNLDFFSKIRLCDFSAFIVP